MCLMIHAWPISLQCQVNCRSSMQRSTDLDSSLWQFSMLAKYADSLCDGIAEESSGLKKELSQEDCGMGIALAARRKSLSDLLTDSQPNLKVEASLLSTLASSG